MRNAVRRQSSTLYLSAFPNASSQFCIACRYVRRYLRMSTFISATSPQRHFFPTWRASYGTATVGKKLEGFSVNITSGNALHKMHSIWQNHIAIVSRLKPEVMAFSHYDEDFDAVQFIIACIILFLLFLAGSINF